MMKHIKEITVFLISCNLLLLSLSSVSAGPVLYTRISSIDENYTYFYYGICYTGDIDGTEFYFHIQIDIWNPSLSNITVRTGNHGLFDTGFEAQFENETNFAFADEIELPATNQYSIPTGLSQYVYSISFIVCSGNLTSLPFGNYTFWVEFDSDINAEYMDTYLQVNSTGEYYSNEELPSNWGTILSFATNYLTNSIVGLVVLTVLFLYAKKIRQLKTTK